MSPSTQSRNACRPAPSRITTPPTRPAPMAGGLPPHASECRRGTEATNDGEQRGDCTDEHDDDGQPLEDLREHANAKKHAGGRVGAIGYEPVGGEHDSTIGRVEGRHERARLQRIIGGDVESTGSAQVGAAGICKEGFSSAPERRHTHSNRQFGLTCLHCPTSLPRPVPRGDPSSVARRHRPRGRGCPALSSLTVPAGGPTGRYCRRDP
jgi:hypothetical protein